jgi:hypothetical protein
MALSGASRRKQIRSGQRVNDHGNKSSTLEVSIANQAVAEKVHDLAALAGGDVAFSDGLFSKATEAAYKLLGVMFYIAKNISYGITFCFVGVDWFAIFQVYADDVRVA